MGRTYHNGTPSLGSRINSLNARLPLLSTNSVLCCTDWRIRLLYLDDDKTPSQNLAEHAAKITEYAVYALIPLMSDGCFQVHRPVKMTIIMFLLDTSGSMNQRTYLGTTLLDVAKGAVELFMKFRSRNQASRWDRYMLLTFEDPPLNIKAGWKESHAQFVSELKNITASGLTNLGSSLKHCFDLLNINRMQSGIDTYGQGRCPYFLEPAMIVTITDGSRLTTMAGTQSELNLPMHTLVPGCELTKEPFRWDQRLFGLVLRLPATQPFVNTNTPFLSSADDTPIDAMCEVTGGRSYAVYSQLQLLQCLESLVQKVQPGVVIHLEKHGPDPAPLKNELENEKKENQESNRLDAPSPLDRLGHLSDLTNNQQRSATPVPSPNNHTSWHSCRKLIYVPRSAQKGYAIGSWPLPEAYWPDSNSATLPPRSAHPSIKFSCTPCEPMVVESVPFDKYELEPSPLTQYILERRQPTLCWQVFLCNSAKYSELGSPFGYLKASSNMSCVNLFVMPYNYPVLLPLLDELFKVHKMKPPPPWKQRFDNYLKTMPAYYAAPLRRALQRVGVQGLVPDQLDSSMSYSVISYLKKLKNQAKMEYDRLVASVGQKPPANDGIHVTARSKTSVLQRKDANTILQALSGDVNVLRQEINDYTGLKLAIEDKDLKPQTYRNPFDIPRKSLLDQVAKMRQNLLRLSTHRKGRKMQEDEDLHSVPIGIMGNYQEYLKKQASPLRELETAPVRQHMFGNPFKVNKNLMIDEADEAMPGQERAKKRPSTPERHVHSPSPKRKNMNKGPIPKDLVISSPYRSPSRPNTPEILTVPFNNGTSPPTSPATMSLPLSTNHISPLSPNDTPPLASANHVDHDSDDDLIIDESLSVACSGADTGYDYNSDASTENGDVLTNGSLSPGNSPERKTTSTRRMRTLYESNNKLKQDLFKLVRRPGRDYKPLFAKIDEVNASNQVRCHLIQEIINEAARFKKRALIELLRHYQRQIVEHGGPNGLTSKVGGGPSPTR